MMKRPVSNAKAASNALKKFSNLKNSQILAKFFKTGKGEYGEGDVFYGVQVQKTRTIAKQFFDLPVEDCLILLKSKIHEERLLALFILGKKFKHADETDRKKLYLLYMKNLRYVNNWDLVDSSAYMIAGGYLYEESRKPLYRLAHSKNLWKKRVAIIATFHFIRRNDFVDTLKIAKILLNDKHDLIHKAVGWMLREIGKRDLNRLEEFLARHYQKMPRTMLRYAIEKLPQRRRLRYLKGTL
jgi:3-methyladenine DNA glycosylase AlkD